MARVSLRCKENSLILADEPIGALDTETAREIMKVFADLNKQGRTIVIVTHDIGYRIMIVEVGIPTRVIA